MKFTIKSLLLLVSVIALLFTIAEISFRRGVESEKQAEKARIEAGMKKAFDIMTENPNWHPARSNGPNKTKVPGTENETDAVKTEFKSPE